MTGKAHDEARVVVRYRRPRTIGRGGVISGPVTITGVDVGSGVDPELVNEAITSVIEAERGPGRTKADRERFERLGPHVEAHGRGQGSRDIWNKANEDRRDRYNVKQSFHAASLKVRPDPLRALIALQAEEAEECGESGD